MVLTRAGAAPRGLRRAGRMPAHPARGEMSAAGRTAAAAV